MRKSLVDTLVERDGISIEEAEERVTDCRMELNDRLAEGDMPFDICEEFFGLEPDYLDELVL